LTLDEIPNDITKETPASFEPTIDYTVVKAPRWPFDKLPSVDEELTTQMKSVGETMSIGRTFEEALQKALRSLEIGRGGLGSDGNPVDIEDEDLERKLSIPNNERIFYMRHAIRQGYSVDEISELTGIDPWFIAKVKKIVEVEEELREHGSIDELSQKQLRRAKRFGFSDRQLRPHLRQGGVRSKDHARGQGAQTHLQGGGHLCRRVRGQDTLLLFFLR